MLTTAKIKATLDAGLAGADTFSGGPYWNGSMTALLNLATGTAAGQADVFYMGERTIASGANDDIDLSGTLANALGTNFVGVELVAVFLINAPKDPEDAPNTTSLTIGAAAAAPVVGFLNAAGVIGPIKPGGFVLIGAGDAAGIGAIVATTADLLRIANSAGAQNKYQIALVGRSS